MLGVYPWDNPVPFPVQIQYSFLHGQSEAYMHN
jgi:hypothetical protein